MRTENGAIRGYYERICMNAPIQGSAADVVTEAQLNIANDRILRIINWRMIIQVYDEIVLTGPKKIFKHSRRKDSVSHGECFTKYRNDSSISSRAIVGRKLCGCKVGE